MPYKLQGKCVYKENADGSLGEKVGCSDTEEEAKKHLEALYANTVGKEVEEKAADFSGPPKGEYGDVKYADTQHKKYPIDTEEHIRAAWNYIHQSKNQTGYTPEEISAIEGHIVSAWKKVIDKNGPPSAKKELEDQMDKAIKPPPPPKKTDNKRTVNDFINKLIGVNSPPKAPPEPPKSIPPPPPPSTAGNKRENPFPKTETKPEKKPPMPPYTGEGNRMKNPVKKSPLLPKKNKEAILFTKEGDRMRWLCDFSNNFRDRDYPPEILSSESHERYVKEVDEGLWPMPELWWWHLPIRLGQADWLGYDKENGIPLAAGYIDKEMEPVADAIAHYPEPVGVSHGMLIPLLERDSKDKSIITRYVTREISALPARAAANTLTEILIGKEKTMALSQDKIASLKTLGFSDEQISEVEARNKAKADEAKAAGIESKEAEAPVVEEPVEEPKAEEPKEEKIDEPVTKAELAETVEAIVKGFAEVVKPFQAEINRQGKVIAEMESKAREDAKKELSATPAASIGALIARNFSAIGNPTNQVDGRGSLVKSGPVEAPPESLNGLPSFVRRTFDKPQ